MKTNVLALLAFASLTVAQFEGLPKCATDCATTALQSGIGNCGTGVACICANESFISGISCCLVDACGPDDVQKAVTFAHNLCSGFGVQVPDKPNCSSSPASSSGGAAGATATPTASGTMNIQTSTPTGSMTTPAASGTTGGAISSALSSIQSAASSALSSATSTPNWGARPTAAAGQVMGALGGIVAAVALL